MNDLYFFENSFKLYNEDLFVALKSFKEKTVDMIFADPPYFLSSGGISCQAGKQVKVDKGDWDKSKSIEEKIQYNRSWIRLCKNVLKDNGTIWISGTFHNIYSIGVALELEGFSIINNITWLKPNPPPNLACRCFTNSTETILWARKQITSKKKGKHIFNYCEMKEINEGKQMKDVWQIPLVSTREKKFGKHPTQKPEALLERIILASTKKEDLVLDPFNGSGTTGIVSTKLGRQYIGIDIDKNYLDITIKRFKDLKETQNETRI